MINMKNCHKFYYQIHIFEHLQKLDKIKKDIKTFFYGNI